MNIDVGEPFAAFTYMNEVKGSHSVEIVFFAEFTDPIEKIRLNPEDHSEFGWFGLEDIDDLKPQMTYEDDPELKIIKKGLKCLSV